MKKVIAVGLMLVTLLTGCGVPDPVREEVKNIDVGFISSKKDVGYVFHQYRTAYGKNDVEMVKMISDEQEQRMKDLVEYLRQKNEKKEFLGYSEEIRKVGEENNDTSETKGKSEEITEYMEQEIVWKETDRLGDCLVFTIQTYKRSQMKALIEDFKVLGYGGFDDVILSEEVVSNKVSSECVEFEFFDSHYLEIYIRKSELFTPKTFASFINDYVETGFSVKEVTTGGYLERLVLESNYLADEEGNRSRKLFYIYFKNQKFFHLEIFVEQDSEGEMFFSEEEKKTAENILTLVTGDGKGSAKFVSGEIMGTEKKGTIGKCNYYRINEKHNLGFTLRFVENEEE